MDVGSQIKTAREAADMSQAELAERTDVSISTVQKWEYNQRPVSLIQLQRIGTATDRPLAFFFEDGEAA